MTIPVARSGSNVLRELVGSERASTPQVFRARARRTGELPFLRWNDRVWSYGEAWDTISRWAGFLRDRVGAADRGGDQAGRVAGYLTNRPEAVWAWLGSHAAGLEYVCLNREHRGRVLRDHLGRSRAAVLVTEAEALDHLPDPLPTSVGSMVLAGDGGLPGVSAASEAASHPPFTGPDPDPADVATVMFTSGTTGRSKAALIPHNQLCRGASHLVVGLEVTSDDVIHAWMPLFHIAGQLHVFMTAALAGASVALVPRFSASAFWRQVAGFRATVIAGLPAIARILWDQPVGDEERRAVGHLRLGIFGPMIPELHRPMEERLGIAIVDTYGMTEGEPMTVPPSGEPAPVGSCGVPGPDFDLAVTDPDGTPLRPGETGEIRVRPRVPDVMFARYEGDDEATAACWDEGWFKTGDLGYRDERGFLFYVDRASNFLRRRGENVSAWELQRLLEEHPSVGQAFVLPVPSELGEDDIKAVVVPAAGSDIDPDTLHGWCLEHMARFMVPRFIEVRPSIPHISVGKVKKDELTGTGPGVWDAERGTKGV